MRTGEWSIDDDGRIVDENGDYVTKGAITLNMSASEISRHIVKCVNCHEELVALVREYADLLRDMAINKGDENTARAVLAKAGEEG